MLFRISANGKVGYIKKDGAMAIPPQFERGGEFSEGLAVVVLRHQRFGVINDRGNMQFPQKFIELGAAFSEGLLPAKKGQYGYINDLGEFVIEPEFVSASHFCGGRACVEQADLKGFVNVQGDLVIPPRFTEVGVFRNDRAYFAENGKIGFINEDGDVTVTPIFDRILHSQFFDTIASVSQDSRHGLIDRNGNFILEPSLAFIDRVADGRAAYQKHAGGKFGYLNERGELICEPIYDNCTQFAGGLACARSGDDWFVLDKNLQKKGAFRAESVFSFSEQMAMIAYDDGVGYIDCAGQIRVPPGYTFGDPFSHGRARVDDDEIECYVAPDGTEVWRERT